MPSQSQASSQLYEAGSEAPAKTVKTVDYFVQAWRELEERAVHSHMSYAAQLVTIALDAKHTLDKAHFKAFQKDVHLKDSMFYKAIKVAEEQRTEDGKLYELRLAGMLPSTFTAQYQLLFLPKDVRSDVVRNGFYPVDGKEVKAASLDIKLAKRLRQMFAAVQPKAIGTAPQAGVGKKPTRTAAKLANLNAVHADYSNKTAKGRRQESVDTDGRRTHPPQAELEKMVADIKNEPPRSRTTLAEAEEEDHLEAAMALEKAQAKGEPKEKKLNLQLVMSIADYEANDEEVTRLIDGIKTKVTTFKHLIPSLRLTEVAA